MELSVTAQAYVFLLSFPLGALLAALYDLFRIFRIAVKTGGLMVFLQDIIYWLLAAAAVFLFFFLFNSGEIRGYVIIGAVVGAFIYFKTVSKIFLKAASFITEKVKRLLRKAVARIFAPIASAWRAASLSAKRRGRYIKIFVNPFKSDEYYSKIYKKTRRKKRRKP